MSIANYTTGIFVRALEKLYRSRGLDFSALLQRQDFPAASAMTVEVPITVRFTTGLLNAAMVELQDPVLGISLSRFADYPHFGALGLSLAAGGTIQELLHRIERYHRLVSDVVAPQVLYMPQQIALQFAPAGDHVPHPQAVLFVVASIVRLLRARLTERFDPAQIQVPAGMESSHDALRHFFRCPLHKGDSFALFLHRADEARLLGSGDSELADLIEFTLRQRLRQCTQGQFIAALGKWIAERLPAGEPTLAEAADSFQLGVRTLQRKLKDEGVTWLQLVEAARRELVERYRGVDGVTVTQLAFLAGYQDVSSFSRAFKRWYGVAPTQMAPSGPVVFPVQST